MIRHIVLLAFKKNLSATDIEKMFFSLGNLQKFIPQIRRFSYGSCVSPENLHKGFLHGFEMEFDNAKDRDFYLEHPEHVKVAKELVGSLEHGKESVVVFDYEI